ncbi:unnamed protein product [Alopecurus aequalis]
MARGKTPAGFIADKGKRRGTFTRRKGGLLTKAEELSLLCGVPVAVVCGDLEGGAPTVMETQQGVLDRYRALPPERRAEHTHRRYIEALLTKENARLAKKRQVGPQALAPPHAEMGRMTLEELRGLLESVDAALAAAAERRRALELPLPGDADAVVVPVGDSGPSTAGGSESDDGYFYPMQQGQGQDQTMIWQGLQAHGGGGMMPREHYYDGMNMMRLPAYEYDPQPQYNTGNGAVHLGGGYQQQMPSNGGYYHRQPAPGAYFQPHNAIALPWNGGFQYDHGSSSHVGTSSSWMQGPNAMHDLPTWGPAESSSNGFAVYPYMHTSGNAPAAEYPDPFTGDNSFPAAMPEFLDVGAPGNGMNYLAGYETQGSSNDLQYSASQNSSSVKDLFGYGSDD